MSQTRGRIFACILLTALANICFSQSWESLNPPLNIFKGSIYATALGVSGKVYAGGDFKNNANKNLVAHWNGTSWDELGSGSLALNANGNVLTLASQADTVYAAGAFTNQSFTTYVAKWNGTAWSELGVGVNALKANGNIYSIVVDKQGNVYAAGSFTNASGKEYVAKWNGTSWSELGSGPNALNANSVIYSIAVDPAGNVYAGGYFKNASGKQYVARWDGISWTELGNLNANDFIRCLTTDNNGNVYAGGGFKNASNENYIAKWNGNSWTEIGNGTNALHANSTINTIAVKNENEVYAAGVFTGGGGNYYIAKWNGTSWSAVNNPQNRVLTTDHVESLLVDANSNIYAGGKFKNKSGHSFVAKWNGSSWSEPGSKGDPFYTTQRINQIVGDSVGNIYVSGDFKDIGGRSFIEHWNGQGWHQLKIPDTSNLYIYTTSKNQMLVDKKGILYVTGRKQNSSVAYDCILKWDGLQWSILEDFPNSLKTNNNNSVYGIEEIEMDPQGNLFAASTFVDPVYGICSIAKWDGQTWSRLPGSYVDHMIDFCVAGDGNLYAYGGFTNETGGNVVVKYHPATQTRWTEVRNGNSRLGVPGSNVFMALATDSNSVLYVNGTFTNSANKRYVAKWDGNSWSELGATSSLGRNLSIDKNNGIYTDSDPNTSTLEPIRRWNGTSWISLGTPTNVTGTYLTGSILATDPAGNIYTNARSPEPGVGSFIAKYGAPSSVKPKLLSFSPARGSVGTAITINGKGLAGTGSVSFGGNKASSFFIKNDSTIIAVVARGSTGNVLVSTTGGTDSLQNFLYTCDSVTGPVPSVSLYRDSILVSSFANHYQWFYNNRSLQNEHSNSLWVKGAGFYKVATSEDKICWVSSVDYPVLTSQDPRLDSLKLTLYPNPSNGQFTAYVKLSKVTTARVYVQIVDVSGIQVLQTNNLIFYGNEIRIPLSIANKGTYLVKVFVNNKSVQQSVIIM
ncbi:MAG TPA: T9SS type A sorting domain-containing protein [Chitinophagaceae bacterium]|nr:T9SS type A sorting domain-containing protein [Chitinophagaceae bacterium]